LRAIGDYGKLPEQTTLDMAQYDLDLIATCLETAKTPRLSGLSRPA